MLVPVLAILVSAAAPIEGVAQADSALNRILDALPGESIALEDAIRTGLDGAVGIRSARADLRIARGSLRTERGAFDPVLFADLNRTGQDTPTASPFSGADVLKTTETSVSAGARLKLPTGTELAALLSTVRLETNSLFAGLNPQYTTTGALTLRQPLLKGFWPSASSSAASAARDLDAARARATNAALAVAADVESKYWDLHAAELDYAVHELLVQRGQTLLEQATHKAQAGLVGPGEVATARTFLAEQQIEALSGEESLDAVSDQLATLLGRRPAAAARFRTATEPPSDFPVEPEDSLVARALAANEELRAARSDLAAADARARGAAWDQFPRLDVLGSLGGNGLAGTGRSITFLDSTYTTPSTGGFSETFDQVKRRDFPTWSVGMSLEVPLTLRPGRGEREKRLGEVERARARVDAVQRDVEEQVRSRRRELEHGAKRLELARTGVEAALEQARIGVIEYQNGRNTAFELVRLAGDVATAQQRYSEALVRTAKAAAELRRLAPLGAHSGSEEK